MPMSASASAKRRVTKQFDGDVRFPIDRIARPYDNAVTLAVQGGQLALGLLAVHDRHERRGRLRQSPQRARRLEDYGSIQVVIRHVLVPQQARDERNRLLPGIGGDDKGTVGTRRVQPLLEIPRVGSYGRCKDGRRQRRVAGLDPPIPKTVECLELEALLENSQLAGKPDPRRNRGLQPLLEITGIECPHRLPAAGSLLAARPSVLTLPVARRHKYEGTLRPLRGRNLAQARLVVALGLGTRTLVDAELPA